MMSGNLNPNDHWRHLSPQALRKRALAAGIRPEQRDITYCGAGIAAPKVYFPCTGPVIETWRCMMLRGKNGVPTRPVE